MLRNLLPEVIFISAPIALMVDLSVPEYSHMVQ